MQRKNGKTNGKTKEIWGREFHLVKQGLDEREVFSFVGGLIDRNNEYSEKLEHLDSLEKLGENTIIEADQEAERIRQQACDDAHKEAEAILAQAEEEARVRSDRILAQAEEAAALQAGQVISEVTEAVQQKLAAAHRLADDIISSAEADARQETAAVREKAKQQAQAARAKAHRLLARSREVAVSNITAKFEAAYEDMLSAWATPDAATEECSPSTADQRIDEPTSRTETPAQTGRLGKAIRRTLLRSERT
jgi:vacuolar-type H+-ATPase subunit H